jgi:hypothetical protein
MTPRLVLWALLLFLIEPVTMSGATVSVHVTDGSGADLQKQLVILRSLDGYHEVIRELTDPHGGIRKYDLAEGAYQLIVDAPYGLWRTHIEELFIDKPLTTIEVKMEVLATHGIGDVEVLAPEADLVLTDSGGKPIADAHVFVRDSEAKYGQWYKTDVYGKTTIRTFGDGSILTILHAQKLTSRKLDVLLGDAGRNVLDNCGIQHPVTLPRQTIVIRLD